MSMREMTVPKSFETQRTNAKMMTWRKRKNPPLPIEDLFLGVTAKANPVLDALLKPQQLDMGEITHRR